MPPARTVDPLHKAMLELRQHGVGVRLEVLEGVFSSAGVDAGTRHLLRRLATGAPAEAATVLDVGCGYGPLALWLAAAGAGRQVVAVDRDARALEATGAGAAANALADRVAVRGSLGYDEVGGERFDLIVSNIPAKLGRAALSHLLVDAALHLTTTGMVAVVVVDRLVADVRAVLDDPAVAVEAVHPSKAYTAFLYRFTAPPAAADARPGFARGAYRRGAGRFAAGSVAWEAEVSFDLPEFDSLSHGTIAALAVLGGERRSSGPTVVAGVGQGHLALALRAGGGGEQLRLVDRDLLALRTAAGNLGRQGGGDDPELVHAGRLLAAHLDGAGAAVVHLPEREPVAVTAAVVGAALRGLDPDTPVVLHGRTSDVQRVAELVPRHGGRLAVADRQKRDGHSAIRATVR